MSRHWKFITWIVAFSTAIGTSLLFVGIYRFGNSDRSFATLAYFALIALVLQSGLILAPIVAERSLPWRFLSISLMMPFIYYFVISDVQSIFSLLQEGSFLNEGRARDNLKSLIVVLIWVGVYGYNIYSLSPLARHKSTSARAVR